MNWTYHTHTPGKYAHATCGAPQQIHPSIPVQAPVELPRAEAPPQEQPTTPKEPPKQEPEPPHILDAVRCQIGMHYQCADVVSILKQGEYPFLHGAPGAGKTTLILQIAEQCQLDPLLIPCSQDMLRSEILGTKNPLTGEYYPSHFYHIWKSGGVVLFDETGLAPGVFLNLMNAALAQHELRFPNGERIKKHANCFICFADNSNLWGTDPLFPERQDAGSAFRDRLTYLKFEYDVKLERHIIGMILGDITGLRWHDRVLKIREIVQAHDEIPVFASPRFAIKGAKALKAGVPFAAIIDRLLLQGLSEDVCGTVRREVLAC